MICPRVKIEEELAAIRGSEKYAQIVQMLADPFDGLMVFLDRPDVEHILWVADDPGFGTEVRALLDAAMPSGAGAGPRDESR